MSETSLDLQLTRPHPQGELFLLQRAGDRFEGLVYNTIGQNLCPADAFQGIDLVALAAEVGCDVVWRNPRRNWMMDDSKFNVLGEPRQLRGLMFNFVAEMQSPLTFDVAGTQADRAYRPMQIHRVNTYTFCAGRPVYMRRSSNDTPRWSTDEQDLTAQRLVACTSTMASAAPNSSVPASIKRWQRYARATHSSCRRRRAGSAGVAVASCHQIVKLTRAYGPTPHEPRSPCSRV